MIDEDRTLSVLGVDVQTLTPGSNKSVFRVCEGCGRYAVLRYCDALQHRKCHPCSLTGRSVSNETRRRISATEQGKTISDETRTKLSISLTGRTLSDKTRKKMSDGRKGKKLTTKTKQKMSEACKGRIPPDRKGKKFTEESKRKLSATRQGITYDEWEAFAREKKYCPKFNEACRESNREKYGRRCFICNKTEKANGQKLSVHHVDMNKAQGCESNWKLVPLCRRHHATAHNDEIIARLGYILKEE